MIVYDETQKILIGNYLKYYRQINNIYIKETCENISCSYKTYKIENGIVKKNDEYYDRIIEIYDIDFYLNNKCFNNINNSI